MEGGYRPAQPCENPCRSPSTTVEGVSSSGAQPRASGRPHHTPARKRTKLRARMRWRADIFFKGGAIFYENAAPVNSVV